MGSVSKVTTTGDNDFHLEPVLQCQRYLYCDQCGAFAMEIWLSPRHYPWILSWVKWLDRGAALLVWLAIYTMVVAGLWLLIEWLTGGLDVFWLPLFLTGTLIAVAMCIAGCPYESTTR